MVKGKRLLKALQARVSYFMWLLFDPSKFTSIDKRRIDKVLVVNLGFIGDLLATTPMIRSLSKKFGKICILTRGGMESVLEGNPCISKIISYKNDFQKDLEVIRKENFDLAVIVWPASLKISLLCLQASIPYRIGTTQTGLLEGKGYFLTRRVKPSLHPKHKVEENLDIARLIGIDLRKPKVEFYFSKKDELMVDKFLRKNKVKSPLIAIHPGKRGKFYSEYSWPLKNFTAVADSLVKEYKANIVMTGSKEEEILAKHIIKNMKHKNSAFIASGKLNLKQFGALLKECKLLVSIDTAAVHIASASSINIPIIVLNAKYPIIWHPYIPEEKYRMLNHPKVNSVLSSAEKFLKKK